MLKTNHKIVAATLSLLAFCVPGVQAQEIYSGAGLFGLQLGYAHTLNESFNARADYMTLGSHSQTSNESGNDYQSNIKLSRISLLADWFPIDESSFRLTGGVSFNTIGAELTAGGAGTAVNINGRDYALGANDTLKIQVKMPSTTPYLGIGWGHKSTSPGFGFYADLGALMGSFKVSETRGGALANGGILGLTQAEMDKELEEIRDSVAKLKVLPQLTLGVTYRF